MSKKLPINTESEEKLDIIRHDCAHVLAEAVQSLFPETQVTIGPTIENGFYYDFAREKPFTSNDLNIIEKKMLNIINKDKNFTREVWTRKQAIDYFSKKGESYKVELINDISEKEEITIYKQGDWLDLCRGPHMPSTKHVGKYSGYMRSIIMGITYASMCDADYWVYVEQDVLLQGKGIIERCIEDMKTPFMFGSGKGTYQLLQQSLIIIHKSGFDDFINRMNNIKSRDSEVAPESKFLIASSPIYSKLPEWCFKELTKESYIGMKFLGLLKLISKFHKSFDELPIGYGRSRPINFSEPFLYFQHGCEKELAEYYETASIR